MSLGRTWMLRAGLLLVMGMPGCGEYPIAQEKAKPREKAKPEVVEREKARHRDILAKIEKLEKSLA